MVHQRNSSYKYSKVTQPWQPFPSDKRSISHTQKNKKSQKAKQNTYKLKEVHLHVHKGFSNIVSKKTNK